jgi:tryptophan synthase alpha chain
MSAVGDGGRGTGGVVRDAGLGTDGTAGAARIRAAFARAQAEGRAALIPYVVAGYPTYAGSQQAALAAIDAGADLLEIGLPYSDPLADGTTLQRASSAALRAGATLAGSLALVSSVAGQRPSVPIVAMGYLNQVVGTGDPEARLRDLAQAGASGLIVADLTPDEGAPVEAAARAAGLALVYLVTPTTPAERRTQIAGRSGGFLYAVSLVGVTGARAALASGVTRFLDDVSSRSPVPVAVGFGVSRPAHVRRLGGHAQGVIVASALIDALGPSGGDVDRMGRLVGALRGGTRLASP